MGSGECLGLDTGDKSPYPNAVKFTLSVVQNNQVMFKKVCDGKYLHIYPPHASHREIFASTVPENGDEDERKRATFTIEDWSEREATEQCKNIEKREYEDYQKRERKQMIKDVGRSFGGWPGK